MNRRPTALVSAQDRFAAAALQVDWLHGYMKRRRPEWHHYTNSKAGIISVSSV